MNPISSDLRYLQRTPAGVEYVRQIAALEPDRRARSSFQDLVLQLAPPGALLFDFGCGPGIDARFLAERGFDVEAYDVDPRMREYFGDYCRDFIDTGRIRLHVGSYQEFLTCRTETGRRAELIVSNFAPLNLVDDLGQLFGRFATLTTPQGKILASVLNPSFLGNMGCMRYRWWWRSTLQLRRTGEVFMPGPQAPHYRRSIAKFRALALPHFHLSRIFAMQPPAAGTSSKQIERSEAGVLRWLRIARSPFIFLLFEKAP